MEFRVLGPLEVIHDDTASAPPGAKERMILARLLLEPARVVPADALLEAAWPGSDPQAAARSLGVRLANLRAFLEPTRPAGARSTLLVRDGAGYRLVADPDQVDAVRLERLVRDAAQCAPAEALAAYEAALALWRGAPFGDVAYADFAQAEIRRLEELRLRAAEGRARALVELGRHEEALPELQRLAADEPLREELARSLALALYRGGRQVEALDTLRGLSTRLVELGLEPSAATRELEQRILLHDRGLALAAAPAPARRLPLRASRFFGREAHLAFAEQLVGSGPLVTIAGVGGAGKTRLALELAHRLSSRFADGPWWCELAPVNADADVAGAVAETLGGLEQAATRSGLLVLDNCEHVLEGAAAVVEEVLDGCPAIRVVATSRAPLGVDGELVLRLAGLEVPAADESSPAVELFVDRAQAAGGMVDLHAIGELCRRLDLPAHDAARGRRRTGRPREARRGRRAAGRRRALACGAVPLRPVRAHARAGGRARGGARARTRAGSGRGQGPGPGRTLESTAMAGHSKWAGIKHKKAIVDARRGKLFTKLARAITVAAKDGGGDVDGNPALALAVQKARDASMPKDNIERAIAKGTGEGADAEALEAVMYEGYGPGGVAVLVEALTDNRNRTGSEMRHIFSKNGGNLGEPGSVAYLFDKKGVVVVDGERYSEDDLMVAIDAGAEDIQMDADVFEVLCEPSDLAAVRAALTEAGVEVEEASVAQRPKTLVPLDEDGATKVLRLIDALEDQDDVDAVHANFDVDAEILERVAG